jgi:alpha-D-ribose 1-methylphosphonate 5-phosphate C-P lyase
MTYVKTQDGQVTKFPYNIGQLRRDNPNTSFPRRISSETLASYGVFEVAIEDMPQVDPATHKAIRSDTPVNVGDKWVLQWSTVEKTDEEKQAHRDAAASRTRAKRDAKLAETDFYALTDNTLSAEMATYRQALRDITEHANFPYLSEEDWPVKPE